MPGTPATDVPQKHLGSVLGFYALAVLTLTFLGCASGFLGTLTVRSPSLSSAPSHGMRGSASEIPSSAAWDCSRNAKILRLILRGLQHLRALPCGRNSE